MNKDTSWFNQAIIYQIYPRSFYDANNDGVGDLKGITAKLDYLRGTDESLGINTIWLSPFFASPMKDFGYDISDFCGVDPIFGTIDDFKELLTQAHARGIRVVIDFVPNHTSDQHPWFKEARSSKDNPKRDWYIWKDANPDGSVPNTWGSIFGGTVWEFDKHTKQYYQHTFLKEQPDLNWSNPEVRKAMYDVLRFWCELGVDGIRIDAMPHISKDPQFRNNPSIPAMDDSTDYEREDHVRDRDGPHLIEWLTQMNSVLKEYGDRCIIVEAYPLASGSKYYLKYYEQGKSGSIFPFVFGVGMPWAVKNFHGIVESTTTELSQGHLPVYCLGNHDNPRLATTLGKEAARTAAMWLLTSPGVPCLYYGDEIDMEDVKIPASMRQDPGVNAPTGLPRDAERTPMRWSAAHYAGFSKARPWLPIGPNYRLLNEMVEIKDPKSFLNLYRALIKFRLENEALTQGSYKAFEFHDQVLGYTRTTANQSLRILINFTDQQITLPHEPKHEKIALTTYMDGYHIGKPVHTLRPHEGVIIQLSK
jgi:alpha-glucosidase